jgi:hypothetical protein
MGTASSPMQAIADERFMTASAAAASLVAPTALPSTRTGIERSCVMCHQRKIRCDKRSPCSNCARVDLFCCYPGPQRAGRRPPKTTIAELATRVARLERTIVEISNGSPRDSNGETDSAHTPPLESLTANEMQTGEDRPAEELLVQDGYSSRYVNEILLSRILDEVAFSPYIHRLG